MRVRIEIHGEDCCEDVICILTETQKALMSERPLDRELERP